MLSLFELRCCLGVFKSSSIYSFQYRQSLESSQLLLSICSIVPALGAVLNEVGYGSHRSMSPATSSVQTRAQIKHKETYSLELRLPHRIRSDDVMCDGIAGKKTVMEFVIRVTWHKISFLRSGLTYFGFLFGGYFSTFNDRDSKFRIRIGIGESLRIWI